MGASILMIDPETLNQVLRRAKCLLSVVSDTPRLDAELLLCHALGWSRSRLLAHLSDPTPASGFEDSLARRLRNEPIAYILGTKEFFSLEFEVVPPLLVPRPETEHLVEAALEFLGERGGGVLDLCTGTGCIAVALAKHSPTSSLTASDIHPVACAVAARNAARHGVAVRFFQGDLFEALPQVEAAFDVIVSNPPYVETGDWDSLPPDVRLHEDPGALLAGEDGLDLVRRIVTEAPRFLRPGGLLAMEIGERQSGEVQALMRAANFRDVRARLDLAGVERVIQGEMDTRMGTQPQEAKTT